MSALRALVFAFVLTPPLAPQGTPAQPPVQVLGSVELTPVEALRAAHESALTTLLEHYGTCWNDRADRLVPAGRVEHELTRWLRGRIDALPNVVGRTLHEIDSSIGKVYRQELQLALSGKPGQRLQAEGAAVVERLNRRFRGRFAAIAGLAAVLLFGCHWLDRLTQGWLTLRLRSACLLLTLVGAYLLYPWA